MSAKKFGEGHNISVSDIKIAFFDFDDTLAIHTLLFPDNVDDDAQLWAKAYNEPENFYEEVIPCKVSEYFLNITGYFRLFNIKMFCLSGMHGSTHLEAKKCFVKKHYGDDIEFLMAAEQKNKIHVIREIMCAYGFNPSQVVHFDDCVSVIDEVNKNHMHGIFVDDVKDLRINDIPVAELLDD